MGNAIARPQLITFVRQLEAVRATHRCAVAALDVFRENLIAASLDARLRDVRPLLRELDAIRTRLSGEGKR
jgi:hypothetical protein